MGVNGIYGLSGSGLDVESMVKVGMMSKKSEYEKMQQKFTQNEWKKSEYLELYGEVQTFNNSTLSQYKLSSNMNARSAASSNESAVTATATANAAPMQHFVEVGQLATAAYLIGTESVERVGEESDSNSTALVDSLFKSLTKNLNGTYTYSDTSLAKVVGLQANDIAFTFKIGDGTGTSNYTISSDENIFTARAYDSKGNSLAITENTKIDSHEVLLENFPTASENVTSLSLDGIEDIATASMKNVFQKIFEIDDETEYNNRFNPLATTHNNETAFTITFADGTKHTDGTASTTSVNFTYGELTSTSTTNTFFKKIQDAVDRQVNNSNLTDNSNISVKAEGGSIIFSNDKVGADNKIDISIKIDETTFIGTDGYGAAIFPEVISEENSVLKNNVPAKASDVFKTLLAIDEYGGETTAAEYLKNYKDSYDIALSIQFTNTKNGVPKTGTADITFAQMASDDNFSDVIIHSLNAAGFDTDGGDADFTISVDATNGKLKITNSNYGDNNAIEFSINPVGIGDADHPYPTAIPETKIIPNQTIADWFDSINGDDFGFSEYMQRLREIRGDGRQGEIAFSVKIDDGEGYTNTIDFTYEDLADTGTKIGSRFKNLEGGNISIFTDTNEIKFTNNALGDYSKISLTLDIPPESEAYGFTLDTNGKINLQGYLDNAKLADFFSRLIDTEFTAQDKEAWKNDTNSAFKLSFVDANGATTDDIDISYKDLVTTTEGSLKTKLQEIVATNADKFGIRTETDADGVSNPRLVIFSSETGTGSSIKAVISDITMGTGNHMAGTATTNSFSINAGKVTEALNNKVKPYGTKINYTDSNIAFTVNFNDGLTTSSIDVQWKDIINGNLDNVLKKTPTTNKNNITWNTNQFENGRISPPNTIEITTTAGITSTSVNYTPNKTEVNRNNISTKVTYSSITKTQLNDATEVKKTPITEDAPITIHTDTVSVTQINWTSSYDSMTNLTTFTSSNYPGGTFTKTATGISAATPQLWYYTFDNSTYHTKDNGNAEYKYWYELNNDIVSSTSSPGTIYKYTDNQGNTYSTASKVYSYIDSDGRLQNSTSQVYSYLENDVLKYSTDTSALYSYPDPSGNGKLLYSNTPIYSYTDEQGTIHNKTERGYTYTLNNKVKYATDKTDLYKYILNNEEVEISTKPIKYKYTDPSDNKEKTNTSMVYSYVWNENTQTTTNKVYSYTRDGGTSYESTTNINLSVTGTAVITLSDIDGLLNIGTADTHYTDSAEAQQSAKNDLTTLFGNVEAGTTKDFTPHYKIINPGTSEDLNSRLIGNINTFLGASPQKGDGGYTPGEYATKLLNFFGGGTTEVNYNETSSTYSITQSGKNGIAKIDGVEHELTYPGTNTVEVKTTINGDSDASVLYYFKPDAEGQSGVAFSKNDVQEISVTYEQLANGYSFNDLVSDINNLGLNIRATYDSVQDRFSIYNKKSGSENEIRIGFDNLINTNALEYELTDIEGLTGDELKAAQTKNAAINESIAAAKAKNATIERTIQFFNDIGLKQTENGVLDKDYTFTSGKTSVLAGKNAVAKIDGVDYYGLDSNNVTVNGVNYTFNAVTNAIDENDSSTYDTITKDGKEIKVVKSDSSTPKVTVNITQDTASIAEKVKSFVEDYNTMLAKLYEWYDEKPNENYKPLTASQKEGMKEEQIEKWEEKAKAGLLYHDQNLYKVISDIRNSITEKVQGIDSDYDTIFSIGISTTGTKGQLKLDETKLNAALAADPDAVYNIFAKLDGGETQYLVEVNGTGTEIWSADPTYGRAVLDDEGNQQTKVENGVTLYLVEVKRKQIWTTNTSLGTVVTDSDGNPMTKTDDRYAYNGIANRLGNVLTNGMKNLRTVAGSSSSIDEDSDLNNLLRELQTKMSNFKRLMDAFESKLYKKYDAMESSLALLGAQLNYVTGAFQ